MAHADAVDDRLVVTTDWTEKDLASQVPGLNYHAPSDLWRGPLTWGVFVALCGIFQGQRPDGTTRLTLGAELHEWYVEQWKWYTMSIELRDKLKSDDTDMSVEAQQIRSWRTA